MKKAGTKCTHANSTTAIFREKSPAFIIARHGAVLASTISR